MDQLKSPLGWTHLFSLTSYAMAIACLWFGQHEGAREGQFRPFARVREPLVFITFVAGMWALESYALYRAPYYAYSSTFLDNLPRLPLGLSEPVANACTRTAESHSRHIPLSVLLFEASVVYGAMWITRRLSAVPVVQPVVAGLSMFAIDLLLDPVVARSYTCDGKTSIAGSEGGLGLWNWYVPKGEGGVALGDWFNVPVFNYALWFAAPMILISVTNLVAACFRQLVLPSVVSALARATQSDKYEVYAMLLSDMQRDNPIPSHLRVSGLGAAALAALALVPAGVLLAILETPNIVQLSVASQHLLLLATLGAAAMVALRGGRPCRSCAATDSTPAKLFVLGYAYALAAWIGTASFVHMPEHQSVALLSSTFGLWFAWLPYPKPLERFLHGAQSICRFVRIEYFSFTAMLLLLGAAMSTTQPDAALVSSLLVLAMGFHVFAYVLNDIIDLPLDRQVKSRANDLLVRGTVSTRAASVLVALAFAAAYFAALEIARYAVAAHWVLYGVLFAAFALMALYNVYGKKISLPPLTDLTQGVSWGLLAFIGLGMGALHANQASAVALPHVDRGLLRGGALVLFAYGAGFLFLINGVHGGLRDYPTDQANAKRTTAILLGAAKRGGIVLSSRWIALFAYTVQTAMFGSLAWLVSRNPNGFHNVAAVKLGLTALFATNNVYLWGVVKRVSPLREQWLNEHLFVLLLPPLMVFASARDLPDPFYYTVISVFVASLVLRPVLLRRLTDWVYGRAAAPMVLRPKLRHASVLGVAVIWLLSGC